MLSYVKQVIEVCVNAHNFGWFWGPASMGQSKTET